MLAFEIAPLQLSTYALIRYGKSVAVGINIPDFPSEPFLNYLSSRFLCHISVRDRTYAA